MTALAGNDESLARGAPVAACLAELLSRATGTCGGKAARCNITSHPHN